VDLPGGKEHEDPQARQYAVLSLGRMCCGNDLCDGDVCKLVNTLGSAMQDYSVDRRGDVGAWVREVGMEVIVVLLDSHRRKAVPRFPSTNVATNLVGFLLEQAAGKIDRLRERAIHLLHILLFPRPETASLSIEHAYRRACHGEAYDDDFMGSFHDATYTESHDEACTACPPAHARDIADEVHKALCH